MKAMFRPRPSRAARNHSWHYFGIELFMARFHRWSTVACTTIVALLVAGNTDATVGQPGTLDASFGSAGIINMPMGSGNSGANAIARQSDGRIVVAGSCAGATARDFCAQRYFSDGTLDPSFAPTSSIGAGRVITPVGAGDDVAYAVAVQTDGKIVIAGVCGGATDDDFCAVRLTTNGAMDSGFGSAGIVITPVGTGKDVARALALQADGKIVLAGQCLGPGNTRICVVRYTADGGLDSDFGVGGIVLTAVGTAASALAMSVQADGKIVVAGSCGTAICALRYNADGTLDANFGSDGKVLTAVGSSAQSVALAVAVQPDGKIVLAGRCFVGGMNNFCSVRYMPDGNLDATFGILSAVGAGKIITAFGAGHNTANSIALQPDGKIVLAGECALHTDFCALRYNADGTIDTSFAAFSPIGSGMVMTSLGIGSADYAYAMVLQPDGKIVLAGQCVNGAVSRFCLLRYDGGSSSSQSCTPDFDGDGRVLATTDALILTRVALGMTGNAVVNGITFSANASRNTWPLIRDYLVTQCGMSLVQ